MRNRTVYRASVFLFGLLITALATNLSAGWVETNINGDVTRFSGGKVKSTSLNDSMWSVIDTATGALTLVSPLKRSYATITVKEFCAFIAGMMGGLSPEQQAMMDAILKKQQPQNLRVKRAGSGGTVAGYSTDKYQILADGVPYMEVWVSTDSRLKSAYDDTVKKASLLSNEMSGCSPMSGDFDIQNTKEFRQLEEKGWILKRVIRGEVVSEVVKLEQKKIAASEFQIPAGYRKSRLESFFGQ